MSPIRLWTVILIPLALGGSPARGATISQTFGYQTAGGFGYFRLHQFDPAIGTLSSISANVDGRGSVRGRVINYSPFPDEPVQFLEPVLVAAHADGGEVRVTFPDWDIALPLIAPTVFEPVFPGATREIQVLSSGVGALSTGDVSSFVGTGDVEFIMGGIPGMFEIEPSPFVSVEGIVDQFVIASFTLTYHFTPVPEPSTLLLVCIGVTSVVGWRIGTRRYHSL